MSVTDKLLTKKKRTAKGTALRERGRQILADKKKKASRDAIGGILPKRGIWVYSPERKKVAGLISSVRRTGELVLIDGMGHKYDVEQKKLAECGYVYGVEPPEYDSSWRYLPLLLEDDMPVLSEFADKHLTEIFLPNGESTKTRKPAKPKIARKCMCGCDGDTLSRFCPGHDMRFRSTVTKAYNGLTGKITLTDEQAEYARGAHWINAGMIKWMSEGCTDNSGTVKHETPSAAKKKKPATAKKTKAKVTKKTVRKKK